MNVRHYRKKMSTLKHHHRVVGIVSCRHWIFCIYKCIDVVQLHQVVHHHANHHEHRTHRIWVNWLDLGSICPWCSLVALEICSKIWNQLKKIERKCKLYSFLWLSVYPDAWIVNVCFFSLSIFVQMVDSVLSLEVEHHVEKAFTISFCDIKMRWMMQLHHHQ